MTETIKFNINIGANIDDSDVKKQLQEKEDLIKDYIKKGKPIKVGYDFKLDSGTEIDQDELNKLKAKCEKQVNQMMTDLMKTFSDNFSNNLSDKIISNIENMFHDLGAVIIDSIGDMKTQITQYISNNSVNIDPNQMINVNVSNSSKNNIQKETNSILLELAKAKEELDEAEKDYKKGISKSGLKYKDIVYSEEEIQKISQNGNKLNNTLKKLYTDYAKIYDSFESEEADGFSDNQIKELQSQQELIANILLRFKEVLNTDIFADIDIFESGDIVEDIEGFSEKVSIATEEQLKSIRDSKKKLYNELKNSPEAKALGYDKKDLSEISGDSKGQIEKLKIEPSISTPKFLKKINEAIEAVRENVNPIEIPFAASPDSINDFSQDIIDNVVAAFREEPIRVEIDKEYIKEQIENIEGVSVGVNANINGASYSNTSSDISNNAYDDYYEDEDYIRYLEEQSSDLDNIVSNLKNEFSSINEQTEQAVNNINEVKYSAQSVADVLVGEIGKEQDTRLKNLKDEAELYKYIHTLRLKTSKVRITKEEKELSKKENPTERNKKRLNTLKQEREQAQAVKDEWTKLIPVLKDINEIQNNKKDALVKLDRLKELQDIISSGTFLQPIEQRELNELKSNEEILRSIVKESDEKLEKEIASLNILKEQSKIFKDFNNNTLIQAYSTVNSNKSEKQIFKDIDKKIAGVENSTSDEAYNKKYNDSLSKKNKELEKTLSSLKLEKEIYEDINKLIKDNGQEVAISKVTDEITELDNELKKVKNELKNTSTSNINYNALKDKQSDLLNALSFKRKEKSYLTRYGKGELISNSQNAKLSYKNYQEEISTEEGRIKKLNELRYKDIKSITDYYNKLNLVKGASLKKSSYDKQLKEEKDRLIASGLSKKNADEQAWQIIDKEEYFNQVGILKNLNPQIQNYETDLNEILKLISEIQNLSDRLSDTLTNDEVASIQSEISKKRSSLETILTRGEITSSDVYSYRSYLTNKKNGTPNESRRANIKDFTDGANTIKDVVSNIDKEINKIDSENKVLQSQINNFENNIEQIRNQVRVKKEQELKTLDQDIKSLKKEKEEIIQYLNDNPNEENIEKKTRLKSINQILRRKERLKNNSNVEANVDKEVSIKTREIQDQINLRRSQIITNNQYLDSLKLIREEQEKERKQKEPTLEELNLKDQELSHERDQYNNSLNESIKISEDRIISLKKKIEESKIQDIPFIEKTEKEIEKLIEQLRVAENELEKLKSNSIGNIGYDSDSEIFIDYNKKIGDINSAKTKKDNLLSENISIQKILDDMSNEYQDEIEKQKIIIKNIEKEIALKKTEDNLDKESLKNLEQKLILENQKKDKLISEYNLENSLERVSKIAELKEVAERSQLVQKFANAGNKEAQADLEQRIKKMEQLSEETGVSFGQIKTTVLESGQEIKTIVLDLKEIDSILSKHENFKVDVENYKKYKEQIKSNEDAISSITIPTTSEIDLLKKDYSDRLYSAYLQEQEAYNKEWERTKTLTSETGELTEEVEQHLLNMQKYMIEYNRISGEFKREQIDISSSKFIDDEKVVFSSNVMKRFGLTSETTDNMFSAILNAQDRTGSILKSSENIEKQIAQQEIIVNNLKEQIRLKKENLSINRQAELERELALEEKKLQNLKEQKQEKNELLSQEQKENKKRIESIKSSKVEKQQSTTDNTVQDAEESKIENTSVVNEIKEAQNEAQQEIIQTNDLLKKQEDIASSVATSTSTSSNGIEGQQEKIQAEISETNVMLEEQVEKAIKATQVSIAEGSSVSISGSVKIDDSQFGNLSSDFKELINIANNLWRTLDNIYRTIANGSKVVESQIEDVKTPVQNLTNDLKEVENVIDSTEVKLSKFGNRISASFGGNVDLNDKEFLAISNAVNAMNKALDAGDKKLQKIKDSSDINATYFEKDIRDDEGNIVDTKPFVKLTATFRDVNGQIIKTKYEYDVLNNSLEESSKVSAKVSDGFTQQERSMKVAASQLQFYTTKLDKLQVKYNLLNLDDFGIDENGKLFAKVGTEAEKIYNNLSGNVKQVIIQTITGLDDVKNKFKELKTQSESGLLSENDFKKMSSEFNLEVEKLENSINLINRNLGSQMEHTSKNLLNKWLSDYNSAFSYAFDENNASRFDSNKYNKAGLSYINQYQSELKELGNLYNQLKEQGGNFQEEQILQWRQQIQTLSDLKKKINSNESKKYVNGKGYTVEGYSVTADELQKITSNSKYAEQVLSGVARQITNANLETVKLSKDNKELTFTYKDLNDNIQNCVLSLDEFGHFRMTIKDSAKKVGIFEKAFGSLKDKLLQIFKYFSAYEIFYKFVNALRNGVEIVKELDSAMVEMEKVSNDSIESINKFAKTSHKLAQEIGSTSAILRNSAADWMRLGYSIKEAEGLAKNTSILMNVSEFETIDEATESMVAMISAFKKEGTNTVELSTQIIDKLNNIGNNYSISTSELAESLKRSSGTLIAAGNTIDEAIAMTVASNALIQDAESTGAALKVVSMRVRGTTVEELEAEGEDAEGLIETVSKLEEKVKSLTAVGGKEGISLLDDNGNYRSTYQILQDIADVWDEIGKQDIADGNNRQAALLEMLAGKNRSQALASLLQNAEMLRDAYESSLDSEGSAAKEQEKWMNSIEAHMQVLQAKWQELWDSTLAREQINYVIDLLGNVVDLVNEIGLLDTGVILGGSVLGISKAVKGGGRAKNFCSYK